MAAGCTPPSIPGLPSTNRAPPACPNVILIDHTDEITQFRPGPGRDLTDIEVDARIVDFQGECGVAGDRQSGPSVDMELNVVFQVARGPALGETDGVFSYFVAIVDAEERIMTKETFPVAVRFDGRTQVTAQDTVYQQLDLLPGDSADDFTVIVGFQLTEEQLQYNRQR